MKYIITILSHGVVEDDAIKWGRSKLVLVRYGEGSKGGGASNQYPQLRVGTTKVTICEFYFLL